MDAPDPPPPSARPPFLFGVILFGFGLLAGILLAFSGYGIEDSAGLVVTVFLALIFCVMLLSALLVLFRKPLLRQLFGVAEAQLEELAGPLALVAERTAERDPPGAVRAARDVLKLSFARYAWLSARRWMLASLTGLIAAMAALAGTALLFKQNQLIETQAGLLTEQTALFEQQVELAEAARNAILAGEITEIAALLGEALDEAGLARGDGPDAIPYLDSLHDIGHSLRMRIIAASRGAKPYRFLRPMIVAADQRDRQRVAAARRQAELPDFHSAIRDAFRWQDPPETLSLVPSPLSPERGQLLEVLVRSGVADHAALNYYGLDLSHAWADDVYLLGTVMQGAALSYASLRRGQLIETDLRGATLDNADLTRAFISRALFSTLTGEVARGPYAALGYTPQTSLVGTRFAEAALRQVALTGAQATLADFDRALLVEVDFSQASLRGATFRGAVLHAVTFDGAALHSVDFDGAFVTSGDFLELLADSALPGSFRADRYEITPAAWTEVAQIDTAYLVLEEDSFERYWKLRRIKPFEDVDN